MDFIIENAVKNSVPAMDEAQVGYANIKVIGCGGAGSNMVGWLYKKGIKGAEIVACNTDQQHLNMIDADRKFLLGKGVTRGLGCGGFPEKGAESAKESLQELKDCLKASDMVSNTSEAEKWFNLIAVQSNRLKKLLRYYA